MDIKKPSQILRAEAELSAREAGTAPKERWQHGQDQAVNNTTPGTPERIQPQADTLRDGGDVGDAECIAAERFAMDYILAELGGHDPEQRGSGSARDYHASMLRRIKAGYDNAAVTKIIGAGIKARLVACFVDNLSFREMARRFYPGKEESTASKKVKAEMAIELTRLAGVYTMLDRHQRKLP